MTKKYVPARHDIIWIDFEPTKGKEIGKYRPALVLSSQEYNQTGLLICCPISTSIRNKITEVLVTQLDEPCVVAANIIHTLSWQDRKAKFITVAEAETVKQVLFRILPLIGAEEIL